MAGKNKAVFGIYESVTQAELAVDHIIESRTVAGGFTRNDISVLLQDNRGRKTLRMRKIQKRQREPRPASRSARSSEELWACWPGSAPSQFPGSVRLLRRARSWSSGRPWRRGRRRRSNRCTRRDGHPEYEAKRYEGHIKAGGVLLSIDCDTSDEITRAENLLKHTGAQHISSSGGAIADFPASGNAAARR